MNNATLSLHIIELCHAGMMGSRQKSRLIYYLADGQAMNKVIAFLSENYCCS